MVQGSPTPGKWPAAPAHGTRRNYEKGRWPLPTVDSLSGALAAMPVSPESYNGHRPVDWRGRSYSPGGRGAGNGVAARSQLYERSNANRRSVPFVVRSFGKKTRGVGPDSKKTRRFRKFRKLRLLSVVGLTGSEDWESGQ